MASTWYLKVALLPVDVVLYWTMPPVVTKKVTPVVVFSTKLYSTSQAGTTMQIINEVNPISILVNGTKGNDKGIDLTLEVTEKFVSEIELDVNPLNITVFLDGVELFTKSLDGPSIVSLNKLVSNEIVLRLYGDAAQVYINIENLKVISSKYSVTGSFGKGTYAAIDLDIDTIDFFHQQWLIERKEIILTDEQIRRSKILQWK